MCGIVGILGKENVAGTILESLRRLEYRGYDSAGIATIVDGVIERRRAEGKLSNLSKELKAAPLSGIVGIGHTRWATHGAPTLGNAHPHATDHVAVVHNGIIENFRELKAELSDAGHTFDSETDTEVIAHLMTHFLGKGLSGPDAFGKTVERLEGAYALAVVMRADPDTLYAAREGSPLAVGFGDGEAYLGSDAFALAPMTNKVAYLEDGDRVILKRDQVTYSNENGEKVERPTQIVDLGSGLVDKGNHRHFMAKEIHEQPEVIGHTLGGFVDPQDLHAAMPGLEIDFNSVPRITMSACGTAFYAALVAKYWFEQLARLSVEVDVASELRYREAAMPPGGLAVFISQSGETADTLAALRYAKKQGQKIASIVNVPHSTIARESHGVLKTHAGPEIGVASTKAFTCQLTVLASMAITAARQRGTIDQLREHELCQAMLEIPRHVTTMLHREGDIEAICSDLAKARDILYIGRGLTYPIALEGALKLKEISYIHAEGYAAGEMKHGPIALIEEGVPVIVIAPSDHLFEKTVSNMQEVIARGGKVVLISDAKGIARASAGTWAQIEVPEAEPFIAPMLYSIPVQLLAYHTAVAKGTDVDQPRNLAKSVTVE
jgi:glucosamine--fructose-6-phosphate aminotransferase (isomerizing)